MSNGAYRLRYGLPQRSSDISAWKWGIGLLALYCSPWKWLDNKLYFYATCRIYYASNVGWAIKTMWSMLHNCYVTVVLYL